MTETIEEQRKVEGFGDPQYTADPIELEIRVAVYKFFQDRMHAGDLNKIKLEQDWAGNTLHLAGHFRPMTLAATLMKVVKPHLKRKKKG